MLELVLDGKLNNEDYAYLIDRAHYWGNSPNSFYVYGTPIRSATTENPNLKYAFQHLEKVDSLRAAIYLPTLYESSVINDFTLPSNYPIPAGFER